MAFNNFIRTLVATSAAGVGLSTAVPGVAHADQVPLPDVVRTITTVDGWQMSLTLTDAQVFKVQNMASAPMAREAFVTGKVTLNITGDAAAAVTDGQLVFGAQLGCQVDLSSGLDLGVDVDTDYDDTPYLGIGPSIGSTLHSGGVKAKALGLKALKGHAATVTVMDAHVEVDQCGGAIAVRLFASGQMKTDSSDDSLNVYSEVVPL